MLISDQVVPAHLFFLNIMIQMFTSLVQKNNYSFTARFRFSFYVLTAFIFLQSFNQLHAQIVFSEPFNEATGATTGTDNTGGVMWTSVCPACVDAGDHYHVQGGQLEGQDTNGPSTWETGVIDISSCPFIEVNFTLSESGTMEACGSGCISGDWVQFQYNIDGSGWQNPSNSVFCAGACANVNIIQGDDILAGTMNYTTGCMPGGNTIQLRIIVQSWAGDEFWRVDNVTVSCSQGPSVDAGTDQTVCNGSTVTLTADNPDGAIISWNNGITNSVAFTPPSGTTLYTVTATEGLCFNTDDVEVVTTEITFSLASNDLTSCSGPDDGEIIISGLTPSTSYDISYNDGTAQGPFTLMSNGTGVITISGLAAGNYTDFLVELGACSESDASVINLTQPAAITFTLSSQDLTTCTGPDDGAISISGLNPSTSYDISYNDGAVQGPFTLMSNGAGVITISGLAAGNYTDFLVEQAGCTGQDLSVINLDVPVDPSVDAGTNQTVCEGTAVTLIATNPDGATLSWNNGVTNGVAFTPAVGSINYTVTATDIPTGCSSTDVVTVTVTDIPTVNVNPAGPFSVSGPTQVITASPAGGTWSADCGTCIHPTTGVFDPADAGLGVWEICYTAGTAPCTATDCISITVTAGCLLDGIISSNNPTCFGFNDGSVTINTTGASGSTTFVITNASDNVVNSGNSNTANNLNEGWYYFSVTDDICTFIDSVLIEDPGPMSIDLNTQNPLCYGIDNGFAFVDTVYNFTGSYTQISYFWNPNSSGLNGIGEDSLINLGEGSYNLQINDENGCSESFDFEINYPDSLFLVQLGAEPAYCRLFGYQSGNGVVFAAASGGTPDYTYQWTNLTTGQASSSTTWGGLNPASYQVTVTDDNGCILTEIIAVDSLNPVADFTLASDELSEIYEGNAVVNVHLENQSAYYANPNDPNADTTFFWHFGFEGEAWVLSEDVTESFDVSYTTGGEYEICLVALNKNGCSDTACTLINVYDSLTFTPVNIFTPDGDGINDSFTFNHKSSSIENFYCLIVDRWGVVITEMTAVTDTWDGTDKGGNECTPGVYFYSYEWTSFNGIDGAGQGTVQLIRME
jgi:gliding motility-associated-like protein